MPQSRTADAADSELRFLEYRLRVVSDWPASRRRQVTLEAVSRRLAEIARSSLNRASAEDLLNLSCRLLDGVFYAGPAERQSRPAASPERAAS